jgi:hypothetical protein
VAQNRKSAFQISYVTITYRSVLMGILGVFGLALAVMYFAFPDTTNRAVSLGEAGLEKLLIKMGIGSGSVGATTLDPGPQQAHFTNIDGAVRVRKASSNIWVNADYNVTLEHNDAVQTTSEGIAKVVFTDGTSYTIKPDSLIVIQENSVTATSDTRVAVKLTTGKVELATPSGLSRGSKSSVTVGDAVANLAPDTSAQASHDANTDQHSLLVRKGSADVMRGNQSERITENEKLSFTTDSQLMARTKEIAPPQLVDPRDKDTWRLDPKGKGVTFAWAAEEGIHGYHIKISHNQFLKTPVVDERNWPHTEFVKNLEPGDYYWAVQSIGDNGTESVASPTNFVRVVQKGDSGATIVLEVDNLMQHGHVFEIRGHTESGARVMVNGQEAVVGPEGKFSHFTNPLPPGENLITITAQNTKGGYNTVSRPVNIQ